MCDPRNTRAGNVFFAQSEQEGHSENIHIFIDQIFVQVHLWSYTFLVIMISYFQPKIKLTLLVCLVFFVWLWPFVSVCQWPTKCKELYSQWSNNYSMTRTLQNRRIFNESSKFSLWLYLTFLKWIKAWWILDSESHYLRVE